MNKIYAFNNGELKDGTFHGIAVAADGHILAQCVSSSVDWLMNDLGALTTSKKCHDRYILHYPHGFEVEWVEDPHTHEGILMAQGKNQELAMQAKAEEIAEAQRILAEEAEVTDGND